MIFIRTCSDCLELTSKDCGSRHHSSLPVSILLLFALFLLFVSAAGQAATLNAQLVDGITGQPLAGQKVHVQERLADGSLNYVTNRNCDSLGRVTFDLAGLGQGQNYVLSTNPYGPYVHSPVVTTPGSFLFRVGTLKATIISGATGQSLTQTWIRLSERRSDGSLVYVTGGHTDATGLIRFDPPNLGNGPTYVLEAVNPINGSWETSQLISQRGAYNFSVGSLTLNVVLADGVNGTPFAGNKIHVLEQLANGSLEYRTNRNTNSVGEAVFDLPGLGQGQSYVLSANPFGPYVHSRVLTAAGDFLFRVGTLKATIVSGATGQPLTQTWIRLSERRSDGSLSYVTGGHTDATGLIRFDPANLGSGPGYVLEAVNPINGSWETSQLISQPGAYNFSVGSRTLNVVLIDGISSTPFAGHKIHVLEQLSNGSLEYRTNRNTNYLGEVVFDLPGLEQGKNYVLSANPYGPYVDSRVLNAPGDFQFRVGTTAVTVIDRDNQRALAAKALDASKKLPNGDLIWLQTAMTDSAGTAHFDLPVLPAGQVYIFTVKNPFSDGRVFHSGAVIGTGKTTLRLSRLDQSDILDRSPPQVSIQLPLTDMTVSDKGFEVEVSAADDVAVSKVTLKITDPIAGVHVVNAVYDDSRQHWIAHVAPVMITRNQVATLTARARDATYNAAKVIVPVRVVADSQPPQITITSHVDGQRVSDTGFLLSGQVSDQAGVLELLATVDDARLGRTANNRPLVIAADSGRWAFAVKHNQISSNSTVTVMLSARDSGNNWTDQRIQFHVLGRDIAARQHINRITFGATAELLSEIERIGAANYLAQQLDPANIDDSLFESQMQGVVPVSKVELQRYELKHARHSRRQLQEVMTWFWENHFNTNINKHGSVAYELAENQAFRANALGRFRDLLNISAKSTAMLFYLDNAANFRHGPNENYARELLELHTLGSDLEFNQSDVEQVARAFTGWTAQNQAFFFDANVHDYSEKQVLGQILPAGMGIEDGERVLDMLSSHPTTANFICVKLARVFVTDVPSFALMSNCANTYLAQQDAPDQMAQVLEVLLTSPDFTNVVNYRSKTKTPLEFLVGFTRALETPITDNTPYSLAPMSMRLFENPSPAGYAETGDDWISSSQLLWRIKFVSWALNPYDEMGANLDLTAFFRQHGYETTEGIVGFLFRLAFDDDYTELEWNTAMAILDEDGQVVFDLNNNDAEKKLRRLIKTVLSYPSYMFQ